MKILLKIIIYLMTTIGWYLAFSQSKTMRALGSVLLGMSALEYLGKFI